MKCLSKVGSALGNPLYADDCTTLSARISYARLLVEIDVNRPLPRSVKVQDPCGRVFEQVIEYKWKPEYCTTCLQVGHNCNHVPAQKRPIQPTPRRTIRPKQIWRSRENTCALNIPKGITVQPTNKEGELKIGEGNNKVLTNEHQKEDGWQVVRGKSATKNHREESCLDTTNGFKPLSEQMSSNAEPVLTEKIQSNASMKARCGSKKHVDKSTKHNTNTTGSMDHYGGLQHYLTSRRQNAWFTCKKIKEVRLHLQEVQEKLSADYLNTMLMEEERELKCQLEKWSGIEESIYKQKSRIQWLKKGDSNTSYFFASVKHRYSQNHIRNLKNDQGERLHTEAEIIKEITGYYEKLLGTSTNTLPTIDPFVLKEGPLLTMEQQRELIQPVSRVEVYQALMDIDDRKAPGCDGLNVVFFKKKKHGL
uniref:Uncharacterized protein n=1 Tax=Nicotiana tabacum TaxID=4097 RepID=A0A1S4DNT7_TOBAC|nr:PREDICTED: uncharacterized protein LOC107831807 [Nicotiana tabacum]